MPKLTYLIAIELPEDEWENAAIKVRAQPLQAMFETCLVKQEVTGTVEASFDGRKAPRAKGDANAAPPPNGADASVARDAARGEG